MEFIATCLFGLEKLLGEEIDKLGYKRTETMDGRVTFEGDASAAVRANINLRLAERVFIKVGSFGATTFTELFDGTMSLPWELFVGKNDAFPVKGHSIRSTLFSVPDCQSIIKKAIVKRLSEKYGISWFEETGVKYQIEFFLFKDNVTLMIDTSGVALHKRGYRPVAGVAPLRETLAAALAITSRPREEVLFWDPFCGSGTIAVEAAMLMTGRAPGANRSFAGEKFPLLASKYWNEAREEAADMIRQDSKFEAYASDIDAEVLCLARENATRAGVDKHIKIFRQDALTLKKPEGRRGTIVCNPPYGERMMSQQEVKALYRNMGKTFSSLSPWQIYIITSFEGFEHFYGKRADKVRKLYNGMIPCSLYQYFKAPKSNK